MAGVASPWNPNIAALIDRPSRAGLAGPASRGTLTLPMGSLLMQTNLVLTLTGPDRIGIVEDVTRLLVARGGNVEVSRMARLGGEFAILMLVSIPAEHVGDLETDLESLPAQGYKVTTTLVQPARGEAYSGWIPYRIEVQGADHEGIIQEVAHYLSQRGINIESMDSETTPAPITGVPLFTMTAEIAVPPRLAGQGWDAGLEDLGSHLNVEIRVAEVEAE
jgi:glycine cleavage system transcriptional repressor